MQKNNLVSPVGERDRPGAKMTDKPIYPVMLDRYKLLGFKPGQVAIILIAAESFEDIQQKLYSSSFAQHCRSEGFTEWQYIREPFGYEL